MASVSHFPADLTLSSDFYLPITGRPLGVGRCHSLPIRLNDGCLQDDPGPRGRVAGGRAPAGAMGTPVPDGQQSRRLPATGRTRGNRPDQASEPQAAAPGEVGRDDAGTQGWGLSAGSRLFTERRQLPPGVHGGTKHMHLG